MNAVRELCKQYQHFKNRPATDIERRNIEAKMMCLFSKLTSTYGKINTNISSILMPDNPLETMSDKRPAWAKNFTPKKNI